MMFKVIDNFLPDAEFEKMRAILMGNGMPWSIFRLTFTTKAG